MSNEFDSKTAEAWRHFQAQLADHLAEMEQDDHLILEAETVGEETGGAAPYVQILAWATGQLRCEAVSNHYLAPRHHIDAPTEARLLELGYQPPTWCGTGDTDSANFWVDASIDQADRLAVMAVRALRDVYGVAHPAFLAGQPLDDEVAPVQPVTPDPADEQPAVFPSDGFDHLQRLVDEALTPWLGHPPVHDDDGDIPIDCGDVVVFVRVVPDQPVVRVFACVATDIVDPVRAAVEVALLNRDQLFFKFLMLDDSIGVHADLMAWPFAASHLRDLVQQLCSRVNRIHDDLAARLDAEAAVDGADPVEEADESLHPAMLTLRHLDIDEPGSVDPSLAAAICDHDRDLILRLLSRTDGTERTTALLRAALRVVVERQASRYDRSRSRGQSTGRRVSPRPSRRALDPTLEDVDPERWNR